MKQPIFSVCALLIVLHLRAQDPPGERMLFGSRHLDHTVVLDVDKAGPPEVVVEFESETSRVEIRAWWDHGELVIEITESEDD